MPEAFKISNDETAISFVTIFPLPSTVDLFSSCATTDVNSKVEARDAMKNFLILIAFKCIVNDESFRITNVGKEMLQVK